MAEQKKFKFRRKNGLSKLAKAGKSTGTKKSRRRERIKETCSKEGHTMVVRKGTAGRDDSSTTPKRARRIQHRGFYRKVI